MSSKAELVYNLKLLSMPRSGSFSRRFGFSCIIGCLVLDVHSALAFDFNSTSSFLVLMDPNEV